MNEIKAGDTSCHQILFRWDEQNAAGTGGYGPSAYSCGAEEAAHIYAQSKSMVSAAEAQSEASVGLLQLPDGPAMHFYRRRAAAPGRRESSQCYALIGSPCSMVPELILAVLSDWRGEIDEFTDVEPGLSLPPVDVEQLLNQGTGVGWRLHGELTTAASEFADLVTALLRRPRQRLLVLDPDQRLNTDALVFGLTELFAQCAELPWTYSTFETQYSPAYRIAFVPAWPTLPAQEDIVRIDPRDRSEPVVDEAADVGRRLVELYLTDFGKAQDLVAAASNAMSAAHHNREPGFKAVEAQLDALDRQRGPVGAAAVPEPREPRARYEEAGPLNRSFQRVSGLLDSEYATPGGGPPPAPATDGRLYRPYRDGDRTGLTARQEDPRRHDERHLDDEPVRTEQPTPNPAHSRGLQPPPVHDWLTPRRLRPAERLRRWLHPWRASAVKHIAVRTDWSAGLDARLKGRNMPENELRDYVAGLDDERLLCLVRSDYPPAVTNAALERLWREWPLRSRESRSDLALEACARLGRAAKDQSEAAGNGGGGRKAAAHRDRDLELCVTLFDATVRHAVGLGDVQQTVDKLVTEFWRDRGFGHDAVLHIVSESAPLQLSDETWRQIVLDLAGFVTRPAGPQADAPSSRSSRFHVHPAALGVAIAVAAAVAGLLALVR